MINGFGSAHVKIGVWPKGDLQPLFPPGVAVKNASAIQIKPVELNWVKHRTSHELNSCKLVELSSAHVKYGV